MSAMNADAAVQTKVKGGSFAGAMVCAIFNIFLGVLLGVIALAATPAKDYKPIPDSKTGKIPSVPAGIWYWAGAPGGDWRSKESLLLADKPGDVTITDGEFNAWAQANLKGAPPPPPRPKTAAKPVAPKPAAAGQKKDAAPANTGPDFEIAAGTPNFHIFRDPTAPEASELTFQLALPYNLTLLGTTELVVFQVRGTFLPGANGPQLQPYYCSLGSTRIPPMFAQALLNGAAKAFAATPEGKKYTTAWGKFGKASLEEGALVLSAK